MSNNQFFDDFDEDFDGISENNIPSTFVRQNNQRDSVKVKIVDKQRKQARKQFKKYK